MAEEADDEIETMAPLADLAPRYRALHMSADATDAAWAALRAAAAALDMTTDDLTLLSNASARFEAALEGNVRESVPLQQAVVALAGALRDKTDALRQALHACEQYDQALRRNVDAFLYMAVSAHIAFRPPEETSGRAPRPPLPIVDLVNPALGDAANNVTDDAALHTTLASASLYG